MFMRDQFAKLHQLNWITKFSFLQNKIYSFVCVVCPLLPPRQMLRIFFDSPSNIVEGRNAIWGAVNDLRWNDGTPRPWPS